LFKELCSRQACGDTVTHEQLVAIEGQLLTSMLDKVNTAAEAAGEIIDAGAATSAPTAAPTVLQALAARAAENWQTASKSIPIYGITRLSYTHDLQQFSNGTDVPSDMAINDVHHIIECETYCISYSWCTHGSYNQEQTRCTLARANADSLSPGDTGAPCHSCLSFVRTPDDDLTTEEPDANGFTPLSTQYGYTGFDATDPGETEGHSETVYGDTSTADCETHCAARAWCKFGTYTFQEENGDTVGDASAVTHDNGVTAHRRYECTLYDWAHLWKLAPCSDCITFAATPSGTTAAPEALPLPTMAPPAPTAQPTPAGCHCDPTLHVSLHTTCQMQTNRFGLAALVIHHRNHHMCHPLDDAPAACNAANLDGGQVQHVCKYLGTYTGAADFVDEDADGFSECKCCECEADCIPGMYHDAAASACAFCPAGKFSTETNVAECTPCASGQFNQDVEFLLQASADAYATGLGAAVLAHAVPAADAVSSADEEVYSLLSVSKHLTSGGNHGLGGVFHSAHDWGGDAHALQSHHQVKHAHTQCTVCPYAQWTSDVTGATVCVAIPTPFPTPYPTPFPTPYPTPFPTPACVPGRFMDAGQHGVCLDCPHGAVSASYNAESCTTCANGQYAVATASVCSECAVGQYHETTGEVCKTCAAGKFAEGTAATSCLHCPSGKYQNALLYHECKSCPTATWTEGSITGRTECVAVPTTAPTASPTAAPTVSPTAAPTVSPTAAPSACPTASPTFAPTPAPTASPTAAPTSYPTQLAPTEEDTVVQTSTATTELVLDGVTPEQFDASAELSVREAAATEYEVHVSQVTVEVVPETTAAPTGGRRLEAGSLTSW
jgi:hypothetical protein